MRLKDVAYINRCVLNDATLSDYAFKYIDISAVDRMGEISIPDELTNFGSAPSRARRVAPVGSTVISTVRTYLRAISQVPRASDPLIFSTGFAVLEAKAGVDDRFLFYSCRSELFIDEVMARSVGVSYPAVSPGDLGGVPVSVPPLDEQRRISAFLDIETARIDQLTRESMRQRNLLDSRFLESARKATTGCAGNARSTSIEWMPYMEAGWSLRKVGREFLTSSGTTPKSDDGRYFGGPVPWVNSADLNDGEVVDIQRGVTKAALEAYPALKVQPVGALIVAMYGQGETKGRVGILKTPACLNQACCALISNGRILPEFAAYWFRAHKIGIVSLASGAGQPNLSQELIRQLRIPAPELTEQERIVRALRQEEALYREQQFLLDRRCGLLAERRQQLITAAVAGRIDVTTGRGVASDGGVSV